MLRLVAVALAVAACSIGADDRPRTAEYATMAILSPNCTGAACHSAFAGNDGIAFDTLDGARKALTSLIQLDSTKNDRDDPVNADIIIWTTQIDPKMLHIGRMPYDRPLAIEDENYLIDLVRTGVKDAQCNPELPDKSWFETRVCNDRSLARCTASWNFGDTVAICSQLPHTTGECSGRTCTCDVSHGDCNHDETLAMPDGCEVPLDHDGDCGGCGIVCSPDPMFPTGQLCLTTKTPGLDSCQCPTAGDLFCAAETKAPFHFRCIPPNTNTDCGKCGNACDATMGLTCQPMMGAPGGFACQ